MNNEFKYDVALSFAGENREYVEDVATFLKSYGVKVFYDKFEQADLWGKNLYSHLNDVYKNKAKYTIMFISKAYAESLWTNHERESAQTRAFEESQEYILPVKFDDTEIIGVNKTVSYLDATVYSPKEVSKFFLEKSGFNTKKRWWGEWERESVADSFNGNLFIYDVDKEGFYFELIVQHGAHTGWLENEYAKFTSHNEALFIGENNHDEEPCHLTFFKINETIQVVEHNCLHYHGMRAYFDGDYHLKKDIFCYYDNLIDDEILSKIYSLLGKKYWESFKKCFNDTFEINNIDEFNSTIIGGGMAGFYTIYEAIIMVGKDKEIWGAFLDVNEVYYFTSEKKYKNKVPKTINKWREKFKEKEVIFITEDMIVEDNTEEKKDRLIEEFSEFLSAKKANGEDILMTEEEIEDFFIRCVNEE